MTVRSFFAPSPRGFRALLGTTICAGALVVAAHAATPQQEIGLRTKGEIRFQSGVAQIAAEGPQLAAAKVAGLARSSESHFLIQFTNSVTEADKQALSDAGVQLLTYVTDNAFYAVVDNARLNAAALAQFDKLRAVQPIDVSWKLHPALLAGEAPSYAIVPSNEPTEDDSEDESIRSDSTDATLKPQTRIAAYIAFHDDVSKDDAAALLTNYGAGVRSFWKSANAATIELTYADLLGLVREDAVQWIELPLPKFSTLNGENRQTTQVNVINAPPYGLNGSGVTALVYDGGTIRTTHVDFQGRATNGDTDAVSDHATHVSGTIAGGGVAVAANRGMAPAALLVNYGFEVAGGLVEGFLYTDPGDFEADYSNAINVRGADISNNSIGTNTAPNGFACTTTGNYGLMSNLIDAVARGSLTAGQPFRIVWANGNERQSTRCLGIEGFASPYHSTSPPALAKNLIAVGALNEDVVNPASFTSYGPSDDGRIKPDIAAPGVNVTSCGSASDTTYTSKSGTSMASPTVCGIGALIIQDYRANYPGQPDFRNSTLKMFLAHTASDQRSPTEDNLGPDYKYGYGLVQAQAAIELERSTNWIENNAGIVQGETKSFFVLVPSGATQAKVTLVWDDFPAAAAPVGTLVNDLDLRVFDASNNQYFPWTLNSTAGSALGAPAVRTQPDRLNNIEQVVIDAPAPGVYRVDIVGFNVPQGPQSYSVAASPQLINCSRAGNLSVGGSRFACNDTANLTVIDCDLNTSDTIVDTVVINVASTTNPAGVNVTLTETAPETATFIGSLTLGSIGGPTTLQVAAGDTVTATYNDADNGSGSPATVTSTATVDCTAPQVLSVNVTDITPTTAKVTVVTNEAASASLEIGTACGSFTNTYTGNGFLSNRVFDLTGLSDQSAYFFQLTVTDSAGNSTVANNAGACYSFTQPVLSLPFSDAFNAASIDLNKWSTATNVTVDDVGVAEPSAPNSLRLNGSPTANGDVLTSQLINLSSAGVVRLVYWYQVRGGGESPDTGDDLIFEFKDASGNFIEVSRHLGSLPDTTTFERVSVTLPPAANHANFRLRIRSNGTAGAFDDWFVDDVALQIANAPEAQAVNTSTPQDTAFTIALNGTDPNNDPISFVITSLPTGAALSDPNGGPITTVPYTLVGNGDDVRYTPNSGFAGNTSFSYYVTDGANQSDTVAVTVLVEPVLILPFADSFDTATSFDDLKWGENINGAIDGLAIAEPSAPNAARLNGFPTGGDTLVSRRIDLSRYADATLVYYYQRTGAGNSTETGEDLVIWYQNAALQWVEIERQLGSGLDMTVFEQRTIPLPIAALHNGFKLRFTTTGTSSTTTQNDDWFVDDVLISGTLLTLTGDMNCDGVVSVGDISGFVLALTDPLSYAIQYPSCELLNADVNNDGVVSVGDIAGFVALLTGGN